MLFHRSDTNSTNPPVVSGPEISNQVSVSGTKGLTSNPAGTGSTNGVSVVVVGDIDGASQSIIWTVATSTGSVIERGFRSGLDLKNLKEEIVENKLLRTAVRLGLAPAVGTFDGVDWLRLDQGFRVQ